MKLKDLIREHRSDLDQEHLPEGLWQGIAKELPQPESKSKPSFIWMAAAALVLSLFVWWQWPNAEVEIEPAALPQTFLSLENDYQENLAQIESHLNLDELEEDPEYSWIFEELQELEKINQHYRQDISAPVPREQLINVLIDYYEKRLRLLRKLQMEIERNQKLDKNENFSL